MNTLEAKKALLVCPGDTIQETIDEVGMSQAELAERMGRTKEKLNELIKGKAPLTKKTAIKLENVLGIPAILWMNLEKLYQERLLEIEQLEIAEAYEDWLNKFPIKRMQELKILSNTTDAAILLKELLKFFRVASPKEWDKVYKEKSIACKIELKNYPEPEIASVWLRLGEIEAAKIQLASFKKKILKQKIQVFKDFYEKENNPEKIKNWKLDLQKICADCGVALIYTPNIPQNSLNQTTRWIKNGSIPLIQMNEQLKNDEAFWSVFYYQIEQVLYQGKKEVLIKNNKEKEVSKYHNSTFSVTKSWKLQKYNKDSSPYFVYIQKPKYVSKNPIQYVQL